MAAAVSSPNMTKRPMPQNDFMIFIPPVAQQNAYSLSYAKGFVANGTNYFSALRHWGDNVRKGLRIKGKITILSFCIVLFALSIGGIILTGHIALLKEEELGQRLLVTART